MNKITIITITAKSLQLLRDWPSYKSLGVGNGDWLLVVIILNIKFSQMLIFKSIFLQTIKDL